MKLFLKISNQCDQGTSTLQTDGQTTCHSNTALCIATTNICIHWSRWN